MAQPAGFKEEIKLYNYQLEAVNWMNYLEKDVKEGKYIFFLFFFLFLYFISKLI